MSDPITTEAAPERHRIEPDFAPRISVATELAPKPAAASRPRSAQAKIAPVPDAAPASPSAEPYEAVSKAIASAQEIARGTALSLVDSRLQTARAFLGVQQKLLEMAHANLRASFGVAHKIVAAPNFIEAVRLHSRFAQDQISTLTQQAVELRQLSAKLAQEAPEPWVDSLSRLKKSFEK